MRSAFVRLEPLVAPGLFLLAVLWRLALLAGRRRSLVRFEHRALRAASVAGWPLAALVFVLPLLAVWDLQPTSAVSATAALAGRIPHLDAHAHLEAALRLLGAGEFTDNAARRPLNACWLATRLGLAGGSLAAALVAQALLLGIAVAAGARVVAARAGLAPMLAFFALVYGLTRDYVGTFNTEPLGVTLAAVGFALVVAAVSRLTMSRFLLGLALVDLALHARPGVQFLSPALVAWAVHAFRGRRVRVLLLALAVMAGNALLTFSLNAFYGPPGGSFLSYPAYTFYGLATGSNYQQAREDHGPELDALPDERARAEFLYASGWARVKADPLAVPRTLAANTAEMAVELVPNLGRVANPVTMLVAPADQVRARRWVFRTNRWIGLPILLLCSLGTLLGLRGRRDEAWLWSLAGAATIASAAVVSGDAGFRGLAVAYPVLAMFVALGLRTRRAEWAPRLHVVERGALASAILLAVAALAGPALVARTWPRPVPASMAGLSQGTDYVVRLDAATPRVLVTDDQPPDPRAARVDGAQFEAAMKDGRARYRDELPAPPFVFLTTYDHLGRELQPMAADPSLLAEEGRFLRVRGRNRGRVLRVEGWERLADP